MAKKHKCKKCPECEAGEKWAVPTADFFSLLLALFIALFAIASVNSEKMKAVKEEFVKIYDFAPTPEQISPVEQMTPESDSKEDKSSNPSGQSIIKELGSTAPTQTMEQEELLQIIASIQQELAKISSGGGNGPLEQSVDGVLLKLPAIIPFDSGSADIKNADVELLIKRVVMIIEALPSDVKISLRGYTSDEPLPIGSRFEDHLDLSIKRAKNVMFELRKRGVSKERLSIAGFGTTNPIAANDTILNRLKNDRVELFIFMSNSVKHKQEHKNILDVLSKEK